MTQKEINTYIAYDTVNSICEWVSKKPHPICELHGKLVLKTSDAHKAIKNHNGFKKMLWTVFFVCIGVVDIPLDLVCMHRHIRIYKGACKAGYVGSFNQWQSDLQALCEIEY